jgi:hypothetical protein
MAPSAHRHRLVAPHLRALREPADRDGAPARRRLAMLLMTLAAWPVAFVVVLTMLTLLGDELNRSRSRSARS